MKKTYSFVIALFIGLICISPPEFFSEVSKFAIALSANDSVFKSDYEIPVVVNSFWWLYAIMASGLVSFFVITSTGLHKSLKIMLAYLFVGAFFSQVPYFSFNAYFLFVCAVLSYIIIRQCDFAIIIGMIEAVFWLELFFASLNFFGHNTLMNFGQKDGINVFFGTIFQHMRFGSLLCILSPFLLLKNRLYFIPIIAAVFLTRSSGYALAVAGAGLVYVLFEFKKYRSWAMLLIFLLASLYLCTFGIESLLPAFRDGRIPIWGVILRTWVLDTRGPVDINGLQTGPFDWGTFLFGHGLDTFYALFPAYKHDPNPFPQAHNSWLQLLWETGVVGFSIFLSYCIWMISKLIKMKDCRPMAGLAIIATDMFFHFPDRMTQTMLPLVAYLAFCQLQIEEYPWLPDNTVKMTIREKWSKFVRDHIVAEETEEVCA